MNWRDQEFLPKLRAVEDARWRLAAVDYRRLADRRLVGCRALVEPLRADLNATLAEVMEALPAEPEPDREARLARLLRQAGGR